MSTSKTIQQSLTDARSENRPPMLERVGSYIPLAVDIQMISYIARGKTRKWLSQSTKWPLLFKEPSHYSSIIPRLQDSDMFTIPLLEDPTAICECVSLAKAYTYNSLSQQTIARALRLTTYKSSSRFKNSTPLDNTSTDNVIHLRGKRTYTLRNMSRAKPWRVRIRSISQMQCDWQNRLSRCNISLLMKQPDHFFFAIASRMASQALEELYISAKHILTWPEFNSADPNLQIN
ncbi:hypothetical protein Tco_1554815 [Tanacetum coccineum]|uniref:Uncharacterized protein n=1 Tax=Tanacetum coccineum TaxID=301880 RepID=A0ABQ5D5S3_9ASTR